MFICMFIAILHEERKMDQRNNYCFQSNAKVALLIQETNDYSINILGDIVPKMNNRHHWKAGSIGTG